MINVTIEFEGHTITGCCDFYGPYHETDGAEVEECEPANSDPCFIARPSRRLRRLPTSSTAQLGDVLRAVATTTTTRMTTTTGAPPAGVTTGVTLSRASTAAADAR